MPKRKFEAPLLETTQVANRQKRPAQALPQTFWNAIDAKALVRGPTALVYDESVSQNHGLLVRCTDLNLVQRCSLIAPRKATKQEVLLLHSEEQYNLFQSSMNSDSNVVHTYPSIFDLALLAAGSAIDLVEKIMSGETQNGMAVLRPYGHVLTKAGFTDLCLNNVAIAALKALNKWNLERMLIVDWDDGHDHITHRCFYRDPGVLYFSIHRPCCPNLAESDCNSIGEGPGLGYNFNVLLNEVGIGNADYSAVLQKLLIPVATEYEPEIIIISAALGGPTGEMKVRPEFYAYLVHALLGLAQSRVAVILEDRYCSDSLVEGAALILRTLLGDPAPMLVEDPQLCCFSTQESILNIVHAHHTHWKSIQVQPAFTMEDLNECTPNVLGKFVDGIWNYLKRCTDSLMFLKATNVSSPLVRLCFVYDDLMMRHTNMFEERHPEQPERIKKIYDRLQEYALIERMKQLPSRFATIVEICLVHTQAHVDFMRCICAKHNLQDIGANYNSVYFHPKTFDCAAMAVGSVLQVVDQVLTGQARSGVCIVRPPGHHAESGLPHGFCIFNNIAIAAQHALNHHYLKRVLIVDWDVHHGNGTQHIFESNPNVLYMSIHRYDHGDFFPSSEDGNYNVVGKEAGEGFNVNIPWNKKGMGDMEYAMAFQQIVMPIAYEFKPELVLVSAGFDAAIGDPLGGCKVTPEAYGLFTHWLTALANGRVIVCLEGGYNLDSISYAMTMCTKSLLGDPIKPVQLSRRKSAAYLSCLKTLQDCLTVQQQYWKSLRFDKRLLDSTGNVRECPRKLRGNKCK